MGSRQFQSLAASQGYLMDHNYYVGMRVPCCVKIEECDISMVDEDTDSCVVMTDEPDLPFEAIIGKLKTELRNTQLRLEEAQELVQRKDDRLYFQVGKLEECKMEILELKREREEMKEKLEGGRRDYEDSLQKLRKDEHLKTSKLVSKSNTLEQKFQNERRKRRELEVENCRLKQSLGINLHGNGCGVEEDTSTSTHGGIAIPPVESTIPCNMCPAVLKSIWELKMHLWESHQLRSARAALGLPPSRSHKAIGGVRKFNSENQARPLLTSVKRNQKLAFICSVCQEGFTRVSQLRKHRARKHNILYHGFTIGCSKCGITFTSRKAHARHRKTAHAPRSKSANTTVKHGKVHQMK